MRVVDWRSVDSTAWIRNAGMGVIFVEHDGRLLRLAVGRRISSNCRAAAHIDLIQDPRLKATVNCVIKERGFDLDRIRDAPVARQLFNLQTMAEWSRRPYPSRMTRRLASVARRQDEAGTIDARHPAHWRGRFRP